MKIVNSLTVLLSACLLFSNVCAQKPSQKKYEQIAQKYYCPLVKVDQGPVYISSSGDTIRGFGDSIGIIAIDIIPGKKSGESVVHLYIDENGVVFLERLVNHTLSRRALENGSDLIGIAKQILATNNNIHYNQQCSELDIDMSSALSITNIVSKGVSVFSYDINGINMGNISKSDQEKIKVLYSIHQRLIGLAKVSM